MWKKKKECWWKVFNQINCKYWTCKVQLIIRKETESDNFINNSVIKSVGSDIPDTILQRNILPISKSVFFRWIQFIHLEQQWILKLEQKDDDLQTII